MAPTSCSPCIRNPFTLKPLRICFRKETAQFQLNFCFCFKQPYSSPPLQNQVTMKKLCLVSKLSTYLITLILLQDRSTFTSVLMSSCSFLVSANVFCAMILIATRELSLESRASKTEAKDPEPNMRTSVYVLICWPLKSIRFLQLYDYNKSTQGKQSTFCPMTPTTPAHTPYRNSRIRFVILALVSVVVFANMYAFNNPQALQDSIMSQLSITQTQFNMLYTIIALPGMVFPFFIGIVIDYLGIRVAFVGLTVMVVVFQGVVAQAGVDRNYGIMLAGRLFFGIAVECLSVAQTCFVSYWFLGKELAFAIGLATTLPELGNALNSFITPIIYDRTGSLGPPLFTSMGICVVSFLCACIAAYIDKQADKADHSHNLQILTDTGSIDSAPSQPSSASHQPQRIKCQDLKQFKSVFWLLILLCMFSIGQYIPFLDNVNKLVQVRFCFSQIAAGRNIMITYLITSLLGFPLGIMVDRLGYKRHLIVVGMFIFMLAHLLVYVYPQCDGEGEPTWSGASWGLMLLGLGYCFYANCIIPSIPIVVSKRIVGSAFGIMLVFENLAMALGPIISGQIVEHGSSQEVGYKNSSLFFLMLGVGGFLASLLMFRLPLRSKQLLDGNSQMKKVYAVEMHRGEDGQQKENKQQLVERLLEYYGDGGAMEGKPILNSRQSEDNSTKVQRNYSIELFQ